MPEHWPCGSKEFIVPHNLLVAASRHAEWSSPSCWKSMTLNIGFTTVRTTYMHESNAEFMLCQHEGLGHLSCFEMSRTGAHCSQVVYGCSIGLHLHTSVLTTCTCRSRPLLHHMQSMSETTHVNTVYKYVRPETHRQQSSQRVCILRKLQSWAVVKKCLQQIWMTYLISEAWLGYDAAGGLAGQRAPTPCSEAQEHSDSCNYRLNRMHALLHALLHAL